MRTDQLVKLLATGVEAVDLRAPVRRCAVAVAAGVLVAAVVMAAWLGVRASLVQDVGVPMLWVKFAFVASFAVAGWIAARRLARPGASLAGMPAALVAPVLAMWVLAAVALVGADDAPQRAALFVGQTWSACPLNIAVLSAPVFAAAMWGMKGFAPTRPMLAGTAAGLLAGAAGAVVYTFHCPELAAPFLATWYVLGMLVPTALGAILGPLVLRW
ncbi:MAG: NrsF family protein [Gemmatimonadales bacterium]